MFIALFESFVNIGIKNVMVRSPLPVWIHK